MDLCDAKEKSEVVITWEKALNRLKGESEIVFVKRSLIVRFRQDTTSNRPNARIAQPRYRNSSRWSTSSR
jgi:hypothetical protein